MRHNLVAPDALAKAVKVTNHTGVWDVKLAWYSLQVLFSRYLEPSVYSTIINCTFNFYTKNVFGCFCCILAKTKFMKHKFPNLTTLHLQQCNFQIIHGMKQCTMCQCIKHSRDLPQLELLWSHDIHNTNSTKIMQNFWLIKVQFCMQTFNQLHI